MKRIIGSPVLMTWLSQGVSFGWMLLVLPLILHQWDSVEVSLWLALSLLTSLGLLADLGFRPTIARAVAYARAGVDLSTGSTATEEKHEGTSTAQSEKFGKLSGTIRVTYWLLTAISAVLCVFPGIVVVRNIISLGGDRITDWCAYGATVIQVLITLNLGRYGGIMEGLDLVAEVNQLQAVFGLVRLVVAAALILSGYGLLSLVLLGVGLLVVQTGVFWWRANRALQRSSGTVVQDRGFDRDLFRSLWAPAWRSGVISLGSYLIGQGTTVVAAQLPDPVVIASYLLTMRVLGFATQLVRVPVYARLPYFNVLRARQDLPEFRRFFAHRLALVVSLAFALILAINLLGSALLATVAPASCGLLSGWPLWILSAWLLLDVHHSAHAQAYMTTNHVPFMYPALVSGALILAFGYAAARTYGVLGLTLVLFLVQLAFNNWYPVYLNLRSLNWGFLDYLADIRRAAGSLLRRGLAA